MSLFSSVADWLWTGNNGSQTAAEQQANIQREQQILANQTNQQIANGTLDPSSPQAITNLALANSPQYIDPGAAATDTFFSSIGSGGSGPSNGPGIGSVITDLAVLAAAGAGIWAFFKFGGVGLFKSLAKKSKWYVVGILGAVALLIWFIWSRFQKTASDTSSTITGVEAGLSALNPFASSSSQTS